MNPDYIVLCLSIAAVAAVCCALAWKGSPFLAFWLAFFFFVHALKVSAK